LVYGPVVAKKQPGGAEPERAECERLCAEDDGATGACQLATLAMDPVARPADGNPIVARGSTVVICEVKVPGHWESESYLPTPFGRRPAGPTEGRDEPPRSAREYFERAAADEARAVFAFGQLALDLEELEAPRGMLAEARLAAEDEARHARWTLALARRYDPGAARLPDNGQGAVRRKVTVLELALENATAGCVGELFGTWLQVFQSRAATEPFVKATAERIARDEARHAALAFRLFDWLDRRLGPGEREAVRMAMLAEAQLLARAELWSEELAIGLGLPDRAQRSRAGVALLESLRRACA
jgi:rubrerythrin